MSEKITKISTSDWKKLSQTSENKSALKETMARLNKMTDDDIDYSDIPDLSEDEDFWREVDKVKITPKKRITIRVDDEVLAWFQKDGSAGYQKRINQALRGYVRAKSKMQEKVAINKVSSRV